MAAGATKVSAHSKDEAVNEIRLVGRVAADPTSRTLPSGDTLVSFRVIVDRPPNSKSSQSVDSLECSGWTARVQRSVLGWHQGDIVEVEGAVRRRFFRTPAGAASRVEIEALAVRLRRRRANA